MQRRQPVWEKPEGCWLCLLVCKADHCAWKAKHEGKEDGDQLLGSLGIGLCRPIWAKPGLPLVLQKKWVGMGPTFGLKWALMLRKMGIGLIKKNKIK